ncbi:MAG: alpha/beta fold hydrolase [Bacteroidia bacterium]|nr:alpha/beta fold hydrolase [Bacteroidia bacterium]
MTIKLLDKIKHSGIIYLLIFFIVSCGQHKKDFKCETSFLDIGNKQLQVFTGGEGDNTIVFESGLGVDGSTWLESGIFDSIGKNNQVIAYDRQGYGKSTPPNETRGMQSLVNDLDIIINKKSINKKVIIVSHSLGGAIARAYAIQHPDRVKALLFIEPNNENFKQYATMPQGHEDTLVQQFATEKMMGAAMEAAQLIENVSFLKQLPTLPDIPVIVITSIKTDNEMTEENVADWFLAHESLGKGITNFAHIKTNKSGHFVYLEEPNLVIDNIKKLIK